MEALRNKLQKEIEQQPGLKITKSAEWLLPAELMKVPYTVIKRTKMDILMKMIMVTLQEMEITDTAHIANLLAVDPLFVEGLMKRMLTSGMIVEYQRKYRLTRLGNERLSSGIYEHSPEEQEQELIYSASHGTFLEGSSDVLRREKLTVYRLADEYQKEMNEEQLIELLQSKEIQPSEGTLQTVVSEIGNPRFIKEQPIPCLEFQVFNKKDQLHFTRVWNTFTERWDEVLEQQINGSDTEL